MADLDLLVDYVDQMQGGLVRADNFTRSGELGAAVWAYLEVLEVDPDNSEARRQVGQVATAVRQFDRTAPGRRWVSRLRERDGYPDGDAPLAGWVKGALVVLLVVAAFALGHWWGSQAVEEDAAGSGGLPPKAVPQNRAGDR